MRRREHHSACVRELLFLFMTVLLLILAWKHLS